MVGWNVQRPAKIHCPQCVVVTGEGRHYWPPLQPHSCKPTIPDHGGGLDGAAEDRGNRYMLVFQDFLTKWPLAGESLVTFAY